MGSLYNFYDLQGFVLGPLLFLITLMTFILLYVTENHFYLLMTQII